MSETISEYVAEDTDIPVDQMLIQCANGEISDRFVNWFELHLSGRDMMVGGETLPDWMVDMLKDQQERTRAALTPSEERLAGFVVAAMSAVDGRRTHRADVFGVDKLEA